MDPAGNGSWETDSVLYTWVPVTNTGVIVYWVSLVAAGAAGQPLQGVSRAAPSWTQPVLGPAAMGVASQRKGALKWAKCYTCSEDWGANLREMSALNTPKWEREERKKRCPRAGAEVLLQPLEKTMVGHGKSVRGKEWCSGALMDWLQPSTPIICIIKGAGRRKGARKAGVMSNLRKR